MSIQFRFFHISAHNLTESEKELNTFLRSVRILSAEKYFSAENGNHVWHICVEYLAGEPSTEKGPKRSEKSRIDYKQVLPPEDFELFSKLRQWRKDQAEKEAIPVYAVFTNEHLAQVASKKITSKKELLELDGVGEARVSKYGELLFAFVKEHVGDDTKHQPV